MRLFAREWGQSAVSYAQTALSCITAIWISSGISQQFSRREHHFDLIGSLTWLTVNTTYEYISIPYNVKSNAFIIYMIIWFSVTEKTGVRVFQPCCQITFSKAIYNVGYGFSSFIISTWNVVLMEYFDQRLKDFKALNLLAVYAKMTWCLKAKYSFSYYKTNFSK